MRPVTESSTIIFSAATSVDKCAPCSLRYDASPLARFFVERDQQKTASLLFEADR